MGTMGTAGPEQQHDILDMLPDGVVLADASGTVTLVNAAAAEMLGTTDAVGRQLAEVVLLQDRAGNTWTSCTRPVRRTGQPHPDQRAGVVPLRRHRAARHRPDPARRTAQPGPAGGGVAALGAGPRAPGPGALGPGRHRRPRAALAADRRQGLRRHPAVQVGQAQRRPEEDDAGDRQRRRRPAHPADRRAARRRPHRHRPALALPAPGRLPRPPWTGWSPRCAPAPAARSPSPSTASCRA